MSDIKRVEFDSIYNLPANYSLKNNKPYHIEVIGPAKIGKTYYASKLDKPFFFDFYNGGFYSLRDIYAVSVNENILGCMESYICQLMNDELRDKTYHTIVFDGFDVMLNKFFNEAKEMVRSNYWEDREKSDTNVVDFMGEYLFKWFSILSAYKYNIVLINGQIYKNNELNGLIKRFCNYFCFEEMYIHYSQEDKNGYDDDGNEIIVHDKIISFDGEQYWWE